MIWLTISYLPHRRDIHAFSGHWLYNIYIIIIIFFCMVFTFNQRSCIMDVHINSCNVRQRASFAEYLQWQGMVSISSFSSELALVFQLVSDFLSWLRNLDNSLSAIVFGSHNLDLCWSYIWKNCLFFCYHLFITTYQALKWTLLCLPNFQPTVR